MHDVSGWTGIEVDKQPQRIEVTLLHAHGSAAGPGWSVNAPSVASVNGLTVAITGAPVWRTSHKPVLAAADPATAVIEAYQYCGSGFLELLHGAFAVVVIDHNAGKTLLAVDRMGIEKLVYSPHASGLVFSSSALFVARFPGFIPRICKQAIVSYLYFHVVPSPQTIFEGVRKLAPASAVEWSAAQGKIGSVREFTYWRPAFASMNSESFATLKEALHAALTAGVEHAKPTHKTGAFLSGGLDSSTVVGMLAKVRKEPPQTFSIGFGFKQFDELEYARIANRHFGAESREHEISAADIVELLPLVARGSDEPFGNASALPTYCCARLAALNGIDHLLAGDGGDEMFAGNEHYAEHQVFERYKLIPPVFRAGLLEPFARMLPEVLAVSLLRKARNYINYARIPLPERFQIWNLVHKVGLANLLHPEFSGGIDDAGPLQHMRTVYESAPPAGLMDTMLYYDWRVILADNDLRKVGSMCRMAGVRVSYPMLHPDVVDVSTRIPSHLKMRGTRLRSFYRDAMTGFLPLEIINKPKHGFGLPFGLWLSRSPLLAELVNANLEGLQSRQILRPDFIDHLRTLHKHDDANYYGVLIWTLSMLEQWLREHSFDV